MNKKMIVFFMAITVSITGCSSNSTQVAEEIQTSDIELSAPGVFPIVQEKQKLTVLAPDETHILDLNTNDFTKWYEEQTNIEVEFIQVPQDSFVEKRNLMIASGQLPDIILSGDFTKVDEVTYGEQGLFLPLNELIEKHGYNTKEVFEQQETLPAGITAPDGNIYALPRINEAYHVKYSGKAWINQVWLDNLGLAYPETTEDLYNVLKAFKEKDPNGNGKADEIPMVGANDGWNTRPYDFLMNSFVYNDYLSRLMVDDGVVGFAPQTEAWREGLRYTKRLLDEKLIMPESLTQTGDQLMQLANNPNDIIIGVGVGANIPYAAGEGKLDREKYFKALSPLKGPNGVRTTKTSNEGYETGHFVITSACKNPELAFKWADGLYSEEATIRADRGIEGREWEKAPEGAVAIDGGKAEWLRLPDDPNIKGEGNSCIMNVSLANFNSKLRLSEAINTSHPDALFKGEAVLYSATKNFYEPYAEKEVVPSSIYLTSEEVEDYTRLKTQLQDYVLESMVSFLTGSMDLDKDWDKYIANIKKLEVDKYLATIQTAYDRTK